MRQALSAWDVFDAVLTPGDVILLLSWRSQVDADLFANTVSLPETSRLRQVRVVSCATTECSTDARPRSTT